LEKGTIDAAEWIGPYDDEKLGFHKVAKHYYFPGWWEGTLQVSLYVNQDVYNKLPKHYQAALAQASAAATADMIAKYDAENPAALRRLVSQGAQLKAFPKAVMDACYAEANKVYAEFSAKDPMFKKVYDDMVAFRDNEIPWFRVAEGSFDGFMGTIGRNKWAGRLREANGRVGSALKSPVQPAAALATSRFCTGAACRPQPPDTPRP